jgi:hypothetical protein
VPSAEARLRKVGEDELPEGQTMPNVMRPVEREKAVILRQLGLVNLASSSQAGGVPGFVGCCPAPACRYYLGLLSETHQEIEEQLGAL